jgi:hypothetical protein
MQHIHHSLNFVALLVCALFLWFLGALWYSPVLFAEPWIAIIGRKSGEKPKGLVTGMVGSFLGDFLLAFVMAHIVGWSGGRSFAWGAFVGFLCWLGFCAGPLYPQSVYEGRPIRYFAINGGYWLIGMVIVGGILAVWH